ncbi:MAG: hypothetical protein AAFO08_04450, partial [Pseudomonadota bacterium]
MPRKQSGLTQSGVVDAALCRLRKAAHQPQVAAIGNSSQSRFSVFTPDIALWLYRQGTQIGDFLLNGIILTLQ